MHVARGGGGVDLHDGGGPQKGRPCGKWLVHHAAWGSAAHKAYGLPTTQLLDSPAIVFHPGGVISHVWYGFLFYTGLLWGILQVANDIRLGVVRRSCARVSCKVNSVLRIHRPLFFRSYSRVTMRKHRLSETSYKLRKNNFKALHHGGTFGNIYFL